MLFEKYLPPSMCFDVSDMVRVPNGEVGMIVRIDVMPWGTKRFCVHGGDGRGYVKWISSYKQNELKHEIDKEGRQLDVMEKALEEDKK